jgi:multiple sugar transport system permease protein
MASTNLNPRGRQIWSLAALFLGAAIFLFPFYYMVIGSLQEKPDTSIRGAFPAQGLTLHNYADINSRVNLARSLVNSGIFTIGVLLTTLVFGVLAGYALARLHFRGRGTLFAVMLLVQIVPFQLLIIPIYVVIVRTYGLADTYLGIMLPFLINSTAVFVFRQFFLSLPDDLFAAAALDGASELRMFRTITLPLLRPVLALVLVVTVIGSFQVFDTIQIATAGIGGGNPGGPGNSSRVLYMYIFQQAFEFNALGYASALAVALIMLLVIVAAIQMRMLRAGESDLA